MENTKMIQGFLDLAEEEGYFLTYTTLNRYLDLSPTKSYIFHYILSFSVKGKDEDGYCFASRETMAKVLNISKSTLDDNLKKLVNERLICRTKVISHSHTYHQYTANLKHIAELIKAKKEQELNAIYKQRPTPS